MKEQKLPAGVEVAELDGQMQIVVEGGALEPVIGWQITWPDLFGEHAFIYRGVDRDTAIRRFCKRFKIAKKALAA